MGKLPMFFFSTVGSSTTDCKCTFPTYLQCKPAFAKKMLQALDQREPHQVHRYIEIENAGHCPNHEAPQAVAHVVRSWVGAKDRTKEHLTLTEDKIVFHEEWGETSAEELGANDIHLGMMDRLATSFI